MLNRYHIRALLFAAVAALHALLLFFLVFNVPTTLQAAPENARVMKITDLDEEPPPPPPPPVEAVVLPEVESIAEEMIETETEPMQTIAAHTAITAPFVEEYLPMHKVSYPPKFDEREIAAALIYPAIAQRSGIEGRVILELFVDRAGVVQQIRVLQESPKDRGFAEAAIKAFTGRKGVPASANGKPVSARYRYPVSFKIK